MNPKEVFHNTVYSVQLPYKPVIPFDDKTGKEHARNSFRILPQGYCERKPINLEKITYGVLSVLLLIYDWL